MFFQTKLTQWRTHVRQLKTELYALYLACRDPRTPWYARLAAICVVGYAFSPIDLIPDFIPILGYLDDLILLPLGIVLVLKLIPTVVLTQARAEAEAATAVDKPTNWIAGGLILILWMLSALIILRLIWRVWGEF
jgi:uncharacterized membrane protein YkvA (DUF1232 family)